MSVEMLSKDGVTVRYLRFGDPAGRPFVILPGASVKPVTGQGPFVEKQFAAFAERYDVCLIDRRSDPPAGMTIEQMAADTAAVMDALGLRDAAVYGVSQGGMIAQALTLARPDLVGCLVLCSTAAHVSEAAASVLGGWVRSAAAGDCEGLMAQFAEHVYSPAYREKYAGAFRVLAGLVTDEEREAFVHLVADAGGFDVRARLHEIRCPVLVIGAGQDRIFGVAASEAIAAATGGTLVRYPDGAHGVYDEDPDVLVRIRAFLDAH